MVASYKYLGHCITDDLSDDEYVNRQHRTLFVQGTITVRKFNMCSLSVKLTLFRTYYLCIQHNSGGITKHLPLLNYQLLIIIYIYINLGRSRDCLCMSVAAGRPAAFVCLCHRTASFTYFGEVLRCPHKRIVTITKVYIARNTIHVEIISFHTN